MTPSLADPEPMTPSPADPAASMTLLRELMRDDTSSEYVEATERRGAQGGASPRRRVWPVVITCVLIAAVLTVAVAQRQVDRPRSAAARQALVDRATRAEAAVTSLEAGVAAARDDLAALQSSLLATSTEGQVVADRIARLELATGYSRVSGPGLVVVLDDADGLDRTDSSSPGRVQDRDVQTAVNGLWQAGAEAVAVNGRRITATTAIRTAGLTILVDFKPVLAPYRIEAIGDASRLPAAYAATRSAQKLQSLVEAYGLRTSATPADQLTLEATTAVLPVRARVPSVTVVAPSPTSTGGSP